MSWSTEKSAFLAVVILLAASGCTASDPDDSRGSPTSLLPTTISTATATESTPPELDPVTTRVSSSTVPAKPTVLQPSEARRIAAEFVDQLVTAELDDNYEAVSQMWSGYPQGLSGDATKLQELVHENPWLMRKQVRFDVVRSWNFSPETAHLIVSVTDQDWEGTFSILLDHIGTIQVIQFRDESDRPLNMKGDQIAYGYLPTEGGAIAYVWGQQLDPEFITVDYDTQVTRIELARRVPGDPPIDLITISLASPEFSSAASFLTVRD